MVVVVAILAVIMAMTVPRMLGREGRDLQLSADRVADLLTMYAQRESLSSRPAGIWHDTATHRLVLMVLDTDGATRDHIHTVVRTPNGNDYGKDLLRQHYETADHHGR